MKSRGEFSVRKIGTLVLFAAAAGAAAWSAWPSSAVSNAGMARADVIVPVLVLARPAAVVPLAARAA